LYVYFIASGGRSPMMKIGKAIDPDRRLAELQIGSPFKLKIAGKFLCRSERHALHVESILHSYAKPWHVRGEWFEHERSMRLLRKLQLSRPLKDPDLPGLP
jgi:hypothetical protein